MVIVLLSIVGLVVLWFFEGHVTVVFLTIWIVLVAVFALFIKGGFRPCCKCGSRLTDVNLGCATIVCWNPRCRAAVKIRQEKS